MPRWGKPGRTVQTATIESKRLERCLCRFDCLKQCSDQFLDRRDEITALPVIVIAERILGQGLIRLLVQEKVFGLLMSSDLDLSKVEGAALDRSLSSPVLRCIKRAYVRGLNREIATRAADVVRDVAKTAELPAEAVEAIRRELLGAA